MRRRQRAENGIHVGGGVAKRAAIWVAVDKYLPTLEGYCKFKPVLCSTRSHTRNKCVCVNKRFQRVLYIVYTQHKHIIYIL